MKLSDEVLATLSRLHVIPQGGIRITETLDRKLYTAVNKALEALGGKWSRKVGAHVFEGLDEDQIRTRLDTALALGEVTTNADLGFFATPEPLAREIAAMAEIEPHHAVLEPSAGDGALYKAIREVADPAFVGLVERDLDRRRKLALWIDNRDELCSHDDFMDFDESEPYDRIVMNPPFCKVGKGDHLDHVSRAFGMLVGGGVLVSILPAGVLFRDDKRHRKFRAVYGDIGTITPLPDGSFKSSGTDVRTCVLKVRRS